MLQGDTWGSIMASLQVDAICKDVEKAGLGYKYKDKLEISTLALVDDIIGVTEAGYKARSGNPTSSNTDEVELISSKMFYL